MQDFLYAHYDYHNYFSKLYYLPTKTQDSIPIISFLQKSKISVRAKCASWYTGNDVIAQISKGMKVGMKGVIVN